jgi:hypothetical protein
VQKNSKDVPAVQTYRKDHNGQTYGEEYGRGFQNSGDESGRKTSTAYTSSLVMNNDQAAYLTDGNNNNQQNYQVSLTWVVCYP